MHLIVPLLASLLIQLNGWQPHQPPPNLPRYDLTVQLDYAGHQMDASQRIEVINRWNHSLSQVALHVPALVLPDTFLLRSLTIGSDPTPTEVQQEDGFLLINLNQPWAPGDTLTIHLDFFIRFPILQPGDSFASTSLGWSDISINAGHWHPILAPYDPVRGWQTWAPSVIGDPYVSDAADYVVEIHAPEGVQIAAGGDATYENGVWSYRLRGAREFAFVASDRWAVLEEVVKGIRIVSYFLPEHRTAGEEALSIAADALIYFQHLYGRYPYADFRIVESFAFGGMEFSGFSYITHYYYENYLGGPRTNMAYTIVHEVAHQWWYGIVGNDQVNAYCSRHLSQAGDGLFCLGSGQCHQIGQLINKNCHIGQWLAPLASQYAIIVVEMAHTDLGQQFVAFIHLVGHPSQHDYDTI